jgi:hypothetical protein
MMGLEDLGDRVIGKRRGREDEQKLQITKYKLQTNPKLQCPKLQTKN